jgi:hypothetical protein
LRYSASGGVIGRASYGQDPRAEVRVGQGPPRYSAQSGGSSRRLRPRRAQLGFPSVSNVRFNAPTKDAAESQWTVGPAPRLRGAIPRGSADRWACSRRACSRSVARAPQPRVQRWGLSRARAPWPALRDHAR